MRFRGFLILILLFIAINEGFSKEVLIFVDNSGGMAGFANIDGISHKNKLYYYFFDGLRERMGDADMGYSNFTLFKVGGKISPDPHAIHTLGKTTSFYYDDRTDLLSAFQKIPDELDKCKDADIALFITDNVLSLPANHVREINAREGFDLTIFRQQLKPFIDRIGGLGIIGVKSGFSGKYYAEFPRHDTEITFPADLGVRPFFIYVLGKKDKEEKFADKFEKLCDYIQSLARKSDIEPDMIKIVFLMPIRNFDVFLDTKDIPLKFFSEKTGGSFFRREQKTIKGIVFFKEDPVSLAESNCQLSIPFIKTNSELLDWIIPEISFQPFDIKNGNYTISDTQAYIRFAGEKNTLELNLCRISNDLRKDDIEIKSQYLIKYTLSPSNMEMWWDQWSTDNDTREPHKVLYFSRWLRTAMLTVMEKELTSNVEKNQNISITFKANDRLDMPAYGLFFKIMFGVIFVFFIIFFAYAIKKNKF